jgi:hypothetical protein
METIKLSEKINPEQSNEEMDESLMKIKLIQDFNEIIAISQLNEQESINFLTSHKLKGISLLISDQPNVRKEYEQLNRFEMVMNNLQVCEFRKDPTVINLVLRTGMFIGSTFLFIIIFFTNAVIFLKVRRDQRLNFNMLKIMI